MRRPRRCSTRWTHFRTAWGATDHAGRPAAHRIVDGVVTNPKLGLQTALGRFTGYAPEVFIDLTLATPSELEQALMYGTRDIVVGPFLSEGAGHQLHPLYREAPCALLRQGPSAFSVPARDIGHAQLESALFSVRKYRQLDDLYRVNHPRASGSVAHMEAQVMMILSAASSATCRARSATVWAAQGRDAGAAPRRAMASTAPTFIAVRRTNGPQPLIDTFVKELVAQAR